MPEAHTERKGPNEPEEPGGSGVYIHGHHESVLRSHGRRRAADSAAYLLPHLEPHHRILDIGCGPGSITADLAALVPHGHVTGLDAAEDVLAHARVAARQRGVRNVDFTTGDVRALGFPDGSFDVVHAHQVLQYLPDPVGALREMRRVCRPGGIVAVRDVVYTAMSWYPRVAGLEDWQRLYVGVARAGGGEPDAGSRLLSWARRAGLTDVTSTAGAWCYSGAEQRAWWSGLWADRTLSSPYARLAVEGGHTDRAGLEAIAEAWRAWGRHEDAWFSVLNGELLCRVN
ncbi:class I SAM-dependent methyltransferase [Streptomyces sp. NPDC053048]|uniref:class I SAM-dependent methyltransferase n=1 Tax=Streptomyces sp. NPDC053048 TaxID=3365694 RepID=UPI0037D556F6